MECLFNAGRLHLKRAAANLSPPTASELVGACLLSSPEWGKLLESYLSTRVARKRLDDIQAHICEAKVAAPGSEVNTRALAVVLAMLVEVEITSAMVRLSTSLKLVRRWRSALGRRPKTQRMTTCSPRSAR